MADNSRALNTFLYLIIECIMLAVIKIFTLAIVFATAHCATKGEPSIKTLEHRGQGLLFLLDSGFNSSVDAATEMVTCAKHFIEKMEGGLLGLKMTEAVEGGESLAQTHSIALHKEGVLNDCLMAWYMGTKMVKVDPTDLFRPKRSAHFKNIAEAILPGGRKKRSADVQMDSKRMDEHRGILDDLNDLLDGIFGSGGGSGGGDGGEEPEESE